VSLERILDLWPGILDQMRQSGAGMLSAVVGVARPTAVDTEAGTLTISFPPGSAFNRRKAEDKENRAIVAEAIGAVVGASLRPLFAMLETEAEPAAAAEPPAADPADENELVEQFISEFDAEILVDDPSEQTEERTEEAG